MKLLNQRYRLEKMIGQGAMGRVFLAIDIQRESKVAIKEHFVKQGSNADMYIKRIKREFYFLNQIDHPHIVKAFELFYEYDRYFIVMEYISGITLEDLLQTHPHSLSTEQQLDIAIKICNAASELNKKGILHRDMKPANIILHDDSYEPHIIDLGIAKAVNEDLSSLTKTGDIVGTPEYLSPESVSGEVYPSSDVFCVGTILYQFFSWQEHSPFFAGSMIATIDKIVNKDLLPLSEAYPYSDPLYHKISSVLVKSLFKNHLQRISSMEEFSSLLEKCRSYEQKKKSFSKTISSKIKIACFCMIFFSITILITFSPNEKELFANYKEKAYEHTKRHEYGLASDYYSKALKLFPEAQLYFLRGKTYYLQKQYTKAFDDYNKALVKNKEMYEVYFHRAQLLKDQKKYNLAIQDLNLATRYNYKFFPAYWLRATIYEKQQKYNRAMDEYTTILEFQPHNARVYKERGLLYLLQEEYVHAISDLALAIAKNPKNKQLLSLEIAKAKDKVKYQENPRETKEQVTNYIAEGLQYEKQKEYDLAVKSYSKAIEINSENLSAYSNRGIAYGKQKKYSLAIADFSIILKRDNNQVLTYMDRGYVYEKSGKYELAIKDYSEVIKKSPREIFGYISRGTLYGKIQQYKKAISDFEKILQIVPYHPMALYSRGIAYHGQKQYSRAIADFNQVLLIRPDYKQAYMARAESYKVLQKYDLAISDYNLILRISPNDLSALESRGIVYDFKKNYQQAVNDFSQAILISPTTFLYQSRAFSYSKQQEYQKALIDIEKAIKLDSKNSYSYYARARIYEKTKEIKLALRDYNVAINLNPQDSTYLYYRAMLYDELEEYQLALRDIDSAISLKKDVYYFNRKGTIHQALKEYEKAITQYKKTLEINPDFLYGYYNCGLVYHQLQKYDLAIASFNKAIDKNKVYKEAYNARALSYKYIGKNEQALADQNIAISLDPKEAMSYYNRGITYEHQGKHSLAAADYKKCIALDPRYSNSYDRLARLYEIHGKYKLAIKNWKLCLALESIFSKRIRKSLLRCREKQKGTYQQKTYKTLQLAIAQFYNEEGDWAGIYIFDSLQKIQVEWRKKNMIKVHVRYKYRRTNSDEKLKKSGYDQRFFIAKKIKNRFAIMEMGAVNSGYFSR
ncbi:tetratricopeptide repeat protein [Candidatus Uabimicrobium sp. HlEnr_7]|uniref:tetratricopeptide repeat protein n=1 Tax=Candidatus Uabimicrobium helgolandensis TaxID=3095367 RepID=UPI00355845A1